VDQSNNLVELGTSYLKFSLLFFFVADQVILMTVALFPQKGKKPLLLFQWHVRTALGCTDSRIAVFRVSY
jgi:hypothetical protein